MIVCMHDHCLFLIAIGAPGRLRMASMPTMTAVAVHQVHHRTGEEQEKRQRFVDISEVFGQQEIRCYTTNHHEANGKARTPKAGGRLVPAVLMVHGDSQFGVCVT
jgi:hypothetical protein